MRAAAWPSHRVAPALAAACLAAVLYAVTLGGTYIFDDVGVLLLDPRLAQPRMWYQYWTESYNQGVDNLYRPLTSMTYALQWAVHGLEHAWAFHLVNVLLYASVCALVAELARRLGGQSVAIVAGLLFAAHPIHVEAVASIVGRAELLCALGTIGGMVVVLRRPLTGGRVAAVFACFLLALLTKEQGMLFPLLLLVLLAGARLSNHPLATTPLAPSERRAGMWLVLLLCWVLATYIFLREHVLPLKFWWDRGLLDWTINPIIRAEGRDRWLMPLALLGRYVQLLVAPLRLSIDYGGSVIGSTIRLNDPYLYGGIAAALAWAIATALAWRSRAGVALFCLLALGLTWGLVSNLVTIIGTNFGERLMFLPSVFFLLLLSLWLVRLPRPILIAFTVIVVVAASARTVTYAARWNDRLDFYRYSLSQQPRSIRLHMLVTAELQSRGMLDQAEQQAAEGRALQPDYWDIWVQSALIAMELGKYDDAVRYLDVAMDLKPSVGIANLRQMAQERRSTATRPNR